MSKAEAMKPQELRIGNWFSNAGLERKLDLYDLNHWDSIAKAPIPLTESWWERAGGYFDEDLGWVLDLPCGATFSKNGNGRTMMYYMGSLESFWVDVLMEIEYVHQLQNLVFALTGTELEFKT